MTTAALRPTAATLSDRAFNGISTWLFAGGALWIAHYAMQLVMGVSTGTAAPGNKLWTIDGLLFTGAVVSLCAGLLRLGLQVPSRWAQAGMIFAVVAATAIVIGIVRFAVTGQPPGILGAVGVVGSCLSAVLISIGARRKRVLDSSLANLLLAIGVFTFPLIVAFAFPAGKWMPAYVTDELPFALSGVAWLVFASRLRSTELHKDEPLSQMALQ